MKNIVGIYLAAGNSIRMGKNKLNLPTSDGPLGSLALRKALQSSLAHTFVVTGREHLPQWLPDHFFEQKLRLRWTHVFCPDADQGQAHTIRQGILAATLFGADAAVILLADQPLIHVQMIDELLFHFTPEDPSVVVTTYDGITGPPILFPKESFDKLLQLQGDKGAKALLHQENRIKRIHCADVSSFFDVDDEDDYQKLVQLKCP